MALLLFDIDGTILLSGGAGLHALNEVYAERFGIENAFDGINPGGMTDPNIFREMLANRRMAVDLYENDRESIHAHYVERLRFHMPNTAARLMPGFPALLEALDTEDGLALGLLTGNLEEGARIKLERFGLNGYFRFGAFGSDSSVRDELVPVAVERWAKAAGYRGADSGPVVVIGDTVRDIACARAHGAAAVAVATGASEIADLEALSPDALFNDFSDVPAVVETIRRIADKEIG